MKLITRLGAKKKNGKCPVYVIVYIKSERLRISTGIEVEETILDARGNISSRTEEGKSNQLVLNNVKKRITQIAVTYKLQHKELTTAILKNEYETPFAYTNFVAFFESELKNRRNQIAPATYKQNLSVLKKLSEWKSDIPFYQVNESLIYEFKQQLQKLGNKPSTIEKNLKTVKLFILKAIKKKLLEENPFDDIKITHFESNPIFLTPEELKLIMKHYEAGDFSEKITKSLTPFLFSCYTGLRISDVKRLKKSDIIGNTIVIMPQKTKRLQKIVKIPLCKTALSLIKPTNNEHLFPIKCEQIVNRQLKVVANILDINKNISYHSSRHTFATNYYRTTKDIFGLQKMLGHSSVKQTQIYAHIIDQDTEINIKKLDHIV